MRQIGKACPDVGTSGQAIEEAAGQAAFSKTNCSTTAAGRQLRIAELLLKGAENALPLRDIKRMVNLPGREIRKQIQLERERHTPIVSNHKGYYLAETERERDWFVRGMKRRAAEIVRVAEAVGEADV